MIGKPLGKEVVDAVAMLALSGAVMVLVANDPGPERRGLDPALKESVAERLLDRYLARQGRVDLVEMRRTYTKKLGDLTPRDLPALVEADRCRTEEERAEFIRETQADPTQLVVLEGGKDDRPPVARDRTDREIDAR